MGLASGDDTITTVCPDDSLYMPTLDSTMRSTDDEISPHKDNKYIVFESQLRELFQTCKVCLQRCNPTFTCKGTLLRVECSCNDGHNYVWESQPYIANKPAGNLLLSAAILFSGSSPVSTLRMLELMNMKVFCRHTYFNYQRGYLLPAIEQVWTNHQAQLMTEIQGKESSLAGDGRCDSPGHNSKYLTYSFYHEGLRKIVHTVQVQANEVASSSHMELEAVRRGLEELADLNVLLKSFTTDRHPGVRKYMRTTHPDVKHQFDVWHVSKGIRKKMVAASKEKNCEALELWVKPVINHLYHCVTHSEGDPEQVISMWRSFNNHVSNVHHGHDGPYSRCLHTPLSDQKRPWLLPDSRPKAKLTAITEAKYLLKDIQHLSPDVQTSGLEAFHSLLIRFAPKSVGYSARTMRNRVYLAILHFNENASRQHAMTEEGEPRYRVKVSKIYKQEHVALPIKEEPTFRYFDELVDKCVQLCNTWDTFNGAFEAYSCNDPPFLTETNPAPPKTELISARQHRLGPCSCLQCTLKA
ncbi:uncharacterized protein LOC135378562 [Ornithodoros turicata]